MTIKVYPLTFSQLEEHLRFFLDIDADTPGEPWTTGNFNYDLLEKWDLSFFATCDNQKTCGFLIASRKENSVHIHRLVIAKEFKGKGIGKQLIETVKGRAVEKKINRITLKVSKYNTTAILFYQKLGFFVYMDQGENHCMELKLTN